MRKVVKLDDLGPAGISLTPRYAQRALTEPIPNYELPQSGMGPDSVYQLIHDELLLEATEQIEKSQPAGAKESVSSFAH
jgi:glutamate/tyrosine decarboxylase-like PLP-dependent enzyme